MPLNKCGACTTRQSCSLLCMPCEHLTAMLYQSIFFSLSSGVMGTSEFDCTLRRARFQRLVIWWEGNGMECLPIPFQRSLPQVWKPEKGIIWSLRCTSDLTPCLMKVLLRVKRKIVTGQSKGDQFGTKDESIKTGERRKEKKEGKIYLVGKLLISPTSQSGHVCPCHQSSYRTNQLIDHVSNPTVFNRLTRNKEPGSDCTIQQRYQDWREKEEGKEDKSEREGLSTQHPQSKRTDTWGYSRV